MSGAGLYRLAAKIAASGIYSTGLVESVGVRRSVATGEVSFPRSDIDLYVVLRKETAGDPEKPGALHRRVQALRIPVPRLGHLTVHEPGDVAPLVRSDTFWAAMERRSNVLLAGPPLEIPEAPVETDHAVAKLSLWLEWFVPNSLARRDGRNLRKTAAEVWNAYAVAEGLIKEPFVRRFEMEECARGLEAGFDAARLAEPADAARFVLELAGRLHAGRLPPLARLDRPLLFDLTTAPLLLDRHFVVLPEPASPLPPEAFRPGVFVCTPESLDLYLRFLNPFVHGALPPQLLELGLGAPEAAEYVRACRYYGHPRFLYYPGFAGADAGNHEGRLEILQRTLAAARQGHKPAPLSQDELRAMRTKPISAAGYYRRRYPAHWRRSAELFKIAASL